MPSLLTLALAAAPRSRATTAALDPPGAVVHPATTVAASATVALLGERPALCPSGAVGWLNLTAVCCDASCGGCSDSDRHCKGATPHDEPPRSACCARDILRAGVPCARPTDTSCVGVAAESVAAALGDDAARAQAAREGAPPRILGLTSSSCRPSDANARLLGTLRRACERYPGLKLIVNLFDLSKDEAEAAGGCWLGGGAGGGGQGGDDAADRPSCLARVTHLPGHKATFWRDVAPAEEVRNHYDYVFAFDNDMRIADDGFDLERAATLLQRSGAGLGQPRIRLSAEAGANARAFPAPADVAAAAAAPAGVGDGNGTAAGDGNGTAAVSRAVRLNGNARAFRSGADAKGVHFPEGTWRFLVDPLPAGCGAQQLDFVENQAPLFTSRAWRAVHTQLLGRLDRAIFNTSNYGLSATWCRLVQRYSGHAIGCALLDEQLVTTDERTIEQLGLSSVIRSGERCLDFVRRTWRAEYLDAGARGGREYTRGECVLPLANA